MDSIKNLSYFKRKLKSLCKNEIISRNDIECLIKEFENHLSNCKKDELYFYKSNLLNIIEDMNAEISFNKSQEKPIKTDLKQYQERAYSKLNYLFRKKRIYTDDEAKNIYDFKTLSEKYCLFLDLINWLNDKNIAIIPEKTLLVVF